MSKDLSFQDIPHFNSVSSIIDKLNKNLNLKRTGLEKTLNVDSVSINIDEVLYITYAETHTYSFKLTRNNPEYYIENIVLHYNVDTANYDEYLLQYDVTSQEYLDIFNGSSLSEQTNAIITELDNGTVSSLLAKSGCERVCETMYVNCQDPDGADHQYGDISCYWLQIDSPLQASQYQSCRPVCTEAPLEIIDAGDSSTGGGNGAVVTRPKPEEPCEQNGDVGISGKDGCIEVDDECSPIISCRPGEIMDEDCECRIDLEDPCANKDLINFEVPIDVVSMIESRQQPNTMVQSSGLVDSFILETIDDGWGDVNQDKFSIKINELPNGQTPFQLFNEIRMNFTNLVVGGDVPFITDVNLEPYSDEDGITWNSDNPVGTAMDFDTILDTSTVYCVEYNQNEMYWVFATVTSYDHQGHFVAGVRQFGLEPNGSGGYSFYVRAADRLGGVLDYVANGLSGNEEVLFTQAGDKTWKNLMENTASFVQNQGGNVDEFDETKTYGARHPYDEDDCQD